MAAGVDLAKMVPGFEFLQTLMKGAGAAIPGVASIPGMSQWIAPTLDPEEIDKRIQELKTVQFWLEQNARLLNTTIQALEVQRMTLSTLQTMNLSMNDLRDALKVKAPTAAPTVRAPLRQAAPEPEDETDADEAVEQDDADESAEAQALEKPKSAAAKPPAPPAVDPLQWWTALTQQFTELATKAVKDGAAEAARNMAAVSMKTAATDADQPVGNPAGAPAKAIRAARAATAAKSARPAKAATAAKSTKSTKATSAAGSSGARRSR